MVGVEPDSICFATCMKFKQGERRRYHMKFQVNIKLKINIYWHFFNAFGLFNENFFLGILGFDSEGNSVDYSTCSTAEEICENATKLLTFIDLAGHQR